jgi:hypothetical protein
LPKPNQLQRIAGKGNLPQNTKERSPLAVLKIMNRPLLLIFLSIICWSLSGIAQQTAAQQIHAHNDYEKPEPLMAAIRHGAGSIEADVFLVNGKLMVAHSQDGIRPGRTLDSLYLNPIARLCQQYNGRVSADRRYTFQLLVDMKDNGVEAIKKLAEAIAPYRTCFDRSMNPLAVQLVISGNRPPIASWIDYPPYLLFDGRPSEMYDEESLKHVGLISDTFRTYSRWNGEGDLPDADRETLKRFIKRAHQQGKTIRFWATPDTPNAWKQLTKLGVDWINTDRVEECAKAIK